MKNHILIAALLFIILSIIPNSSYADTELSILKDKNINQYLKLLKNKKYELLIKKMTSDTSNLNNFNKKIDSLIKISGDSNITTELIKLYKNGKKKYLNSIIYINREKIAYVQLFKELKLNSDREKLKFINLVLKNIPNFDFERNIFWLNKKIKILHKNNEIIEEKFKLAKLNFQFGKIDITRKILDSILKIGDFEKRYSNIINFLKLINDNSQIIYFCHKDIKYYEDKLSNIKSSQKGLSSKLVKINIDKKLNELYILKFLALIKSDNVKEKEFINTIFILKNRVKTMKSNQQEQLIKIICHSDGLKEHRKKIENLLITILKNLEKEKKYSDELSDLIVDFISRIDNFKKVSFLFEKMNNNCFCNLKVLSKKIDNFKKISGKFLFKEDCITISSLWNKYKIDKFLISKIDIATDKSKDKYLYFKKISEIINYPQFLEKLIPIIEKHHKEFSEGDYSSLLVEIHYRIGDLFTYYDRLIHDYLINSKFYLAVSIIKAASLMGNSDNGIRNVSTRINRLTDDEKKQLYHLIIKKSQNGIILDKFIKKVVKFREDELSNLVNNFNKIDKNEKILNFYLTNIKKISDNGLIKIINSLLDKNREKLAYRFEKNILKGDNLKKIIKIFKKYKSKKIETLFYKRLLISPQSNILSFVEYLNRENLKSEILTFFRIYLKDNLNYKIIISLLNKNYKTLNFKKIIEIISKENSDTITDEDFLKLLQQNLKNNRIEVYNLLSKLILKNIDFESISMKETPWLFSLLMSSKINLNYLKPFEELFKLNNMPQFSLLITNIYVKNALYDEGINYFKTTIQKNFYPSILSLLIIQKEKKCFDEVNKLIKEIVCNNSLSYEIKRNLYITITSQYKNYTDDSDMEKILNFLISLKNEQNHNKYLKDIFELYGKNCEIKHLKEIVKKESKRFNQHKIEIYEILISIQNIGNSDIYNFIDEKINFLMINNPKNELKYKKIAFINYINLLTKTRANIGQKYKKLIIRYREKIIKKGVEISNLSILKRDVSQEIGDILNRIGLIKASKNFYWNSSTYDMALLTRLSKNFYNDPKKMDYIFNNFSNRNIILLNYLNYLISHKKEKIVDNLLKKYNFLRNIEIIRGLLIGLTKIKSLSSNSVGKILKKYEKKLTIDEKIKILKNNLYIRNFIGKNSEIKSIKILKSLADSFSNISTLYLSGNLELIKKMSQFMKKKVLIKFINLLVSKNGTPEEIEFFLNKVNPYISENLSFNKFNKLKMIHNKKLMIIYINRLEKIDDYSKKWDFFSKNIVPITNKNNYEILKKYLSKNNNNYRKLAMEAYISLKNHDRKKAIKEYIKTIQLTFEDSLELVELKKLLNKK